MSKKERENNLFAFSKENYILLLIGIVTVIIGFLLLSGPSTTETHFEADIFSFRRITIAPVVSFLGYIFIVFAILYKKK